MTISQLETFTRFITNTDTTSLTAANLLILENKYYEQILAKIFTETAGAETQFGDINYTGFPTFTITMSNGVQAYDWVNDISKTSPLTATGLLTIMGVEVLDNSGTWHPLAKISLKKIREMGFAQSNYYSTNGQPVEYEIRDNEIVLYPAPDNGVTVTLSNGLRIFFLRTAQIFTSGEQTTGTKEPGFPSPWHDLMSYGPASDFSYANQDFASGDRFRAIYDKKEKELLNFIAGRDQDARKFMSSRITRYV